MDQTVDPAVRLAGVQITFPRPGGDPLVIASDLDLSVAPGELHCLAGRSGSGKTSVLRVAAGLAAPDAGTVHWGDQDIAAVRDAAVARLRRSWVGYLDQGSVLLQGLSVVENVLLPAVPQRRAAELRDRALSLLDRLGLADLHGALPGTLSGGERQRAALARALLLAPRVIMADEPTASLDRASADAVIGMLREVAATGTAVLTATHDPGLIAAADSRTAFA